MAKQPARDYFAVVKDGRLPKGISEGIVGFLRMMEGRKLKISITEYKGKRSLNQNAYYFGMIGKYLVPIFNESGNAWDEFDIHTHLMGELGYVEVLYAPTGKPYAKRLHSSEFDKGEWELYMEKFRAYCATNLGIGIPLPNEDLDI